MESEPKKPKMTKEKELVLIFWFFIFQVHQKFCLYLENSFQNYIPNKPSYFCVIRKIYM